MSYVKTCAYCSAPGDLTKEHIFPNFISKQSFDFSVKWIKNSNNIFNSDLIIKDVCKTCNNGKLSKLDSYLMTLYKSYFDKIVKDKSKFWFSYDYNLLIRSLLKISYNASRAVNSSDLNLLRTLKDFIINNEESDKGTFALFLQVISPYHCSKEEKNKCGMERIDPIGTQTGVSYINGILPRYIRLNSYMFFIFYLELSENKMEKKESIKNIEKSLEMSYINPNKQKEKIQLSSKTLLDISDCSDNNLSKWQSWIHKNYS